MHFVWQAENEHRNTTELVKKVQTYFGHRLALTIIMDVFLMSAYAISASISVYQLAIYGV